MTSSHMLRRFSQPPTSLQAAQPDAIMQYVHLSTQRLQIECRIFAVWVIPALNSDAEIRDISRDTHNSPQATKRRSLLFTLCLFSLFSRPFIAWRISSILCITNTLQYSNPLLQAALQLSVKSRRCFELPIVSKVVRHSTVHMQFDRHVALFQSFSV